MPRGKSEKAPKRVKPQTRSRWWRYVPADSGEYGDLAPHKICIGPASTAEEAGQVVHITTELMMRFYKHGEVPIDIGLNTDFLSWYDGYSEGLSAKRYDGPGSWSPDDVFTVEWTPDRAAWIIHERPEGGVLSRQQIPEVFLEEYLEERFHPDALAEADLLEFYLDRMEELAHAFGMYDDAPSRAIQAYHDFRSADKRPDFKDMLTPIDVFHNQVSRAVSDLVFRIGQVGRDPRKVVIADRYLVDGLDPSVRPEEVLLSPRAKLTRYETMFRLAGSEKLAPNVGTKPDLKLTELKIRILEELDEAAYKLEPFQRRLEAIGVKRGTTSIKTALKELKKAGKVDNLPGLGYYRPDKPPKPVSRHGA